MILKKLFSWYYYGFLIIVPFLLWLAFKDISLADVVRTLSGIGAFKFGILTALNSLIVVTMTARWWLILGALGYHIPYRTLIGYRLAGNAVSYFTPGPQFGGEPIQVYLLHQNRIHHTPKMPVEVATASVTIDRLLELVANFTILLMGSLGMIHVHLFHPIFDQKVLLVLWGMLALPVGILWAICSGKRPFTRLAKMIGRLSIFNANSSARWWYTILQTISGAEVYAESLYLRKPSILLQTGLCSAVNWVCLLGEFWFIFWCLGVTLTMIQLLITITVARFAFLTPLPGGLGALEAGQVWVVNALGFNPALGLSVCVIIRLRDLIVGLLGLGLISVFLTSRDRKQIAP